MKDSENGNKFKPTNRLIYCHFNSHAVSPGPALLDATKTIVIAQCGRSLSQLPRRTNVFSSTAATIEDDADDHLGAGEDFDKEVYRQLIELYTSPADWIINMQLATGT